jgi:hypothetical protein
MKEEYNALASLILDSLKSAPFKLAWLNIEMASDVVGIRGEYIDMEGQEKNIEIETDIHHFGVVRKIKQQTESHPLQHAKWNRAKFTISTAGKYTMQYIWDQNLQNEVDKYSKDLN